MGPMAASGSLTYEGTRNGKDRIDTCICVLCAGHTTPGSQNTFCSCLRRQELSTHQGTVSLPTSQACANPLYTRQSHNCVAVLQVYSAEALEEGLASAASSFIESKLKMHIYIQADIEIRDVDVHNSCTCSAAIDASMEGCDVDLLLIKLFLMQVKSRSRSVSKR